MRAVLLISNLSKRQKHFCKVSEILASVLGWVFVLYCNSVTSLSAFVIVYNFGIELHYRIKFMSAAAPSMLVFYYFAK